MPEPLLQVRDLSLDLAGVPIVRGISFDLPASSIVGLFGESGCGKTSTALALLNLLPRPRYRVGGSVRLNGRELLSLSEKQLEKTRGRQIALVFQDPALALNPVLRVGDQVREILRAHQVQADIASLFELVKLPADRRILQAYPHQLSGGERQRVTLAQALACGPSVVIADEPFTALDPVRVVELAALFRDLRDRTGTSFLVISHSPGVLARLADTVLVMERGVIVERGAPLQVFHQPSHPYTAALLSALPRLPTEGASDVR